MVSIPSKLGLLRSLAFWKVGCPKLRVREIVCTEFLGSETSSCWLLGLQLRQKTWLISFKVKADTRKFSKVYRNRMLHSIKWWSKTTDLLVKKRTQAWRSRHPPEMREAACQGERLWSLEKRGAQTELWKSSQVKSEDGRGQGESSIKWICNFSLKQQGLISPGADFTEADGLTMSEWGAIGALPLRIEPYVLSCITNLKWEIMHD